METLTRAGEPSVRSAALLALRAVEQEALAFDATATDAEGLRLVIRAPLAMAREGLLDLEAGEVRDACLRAARRALGPSESKAVLVALSSVLDDYRRAGVKEAPRRLALEVLEHNTDLLVGSELQVIGFLARAALASAELEYTDEALRLARRTLSIVHDDMDRANRGVRWQLYIGAAAGIAHRARVLAFKRLGLNAEAQRALDSLRDEAEYLRWLTDWSELDAPMYFEEAQQQTTPIESMHQVSRVTVEGMKGRSRRVRAIIAEIRADEAWDALDLEARGELLLYDMLFAGVIAENEPIDSQRRPELEAAWRQSVLELRGLEGRKRWVELEHLRRSAELALRLGDVEAARARLEEFGPVQELRHSGGADSPTVARARANRAVLELAVLRREGAELSSPFEAAAAAFRESVQALRAEPIREGGAAPLHYKGQRFLIYELIEGALAAFPDEARAGEAALESLLLAQEMGTLARLGGVEGSTTAHMREILVDEAHGLVFFFAAPAGGRICVLESERVRWFPTAHPDEIERLARDLRQRIEQPPWADSNGRAAALTKGAEQLAAALLAPAARAAFSRWKRVTLVGTDCYSGVVPFSLLRVEDAPLWRTHEVDYLASGPLARLLARHEPRFAFERGLEDLLVSGAEASPQAAAYSKAALDMPFESADLGDLRNLGVRVMWGDDATQARLFAEDLGHIRVLQFLLHGVVDRTRLAPSGLVMTPTDGGDGILWSDEVAERSGPSGVAAFPLHVVLTACRSASSHTLRGEDGVGSMAGAWLVGGTRSVLDTAFDLDAEYALELSLAYLTALTHDGTSPSAALARALEELAAKGDYGDPYFHAGLRVHGLGHLALPPLASSAAEAPESRRGRPAVLVSIAVCLVLVVAFAVRGARARELG